MHSKSAVLRLQVESALARQMSSPFRLPESVPPCTVPSGIPLLDEVTGGLPRGSITELYGPASSGKTSILQSALVARTANSEVCALVDAHDSFDPFCAQAAGVSLRQLLWVRCRNLHQAFRSVDVLLHGGGFGMVVMDLSDVPARLVRKIPLNVWFRLRRIVENTSTILLVLSQESNTKTCASLVLRLEKEAAAWTPRKRSMTEPVPHTSACLLDGWTTGSEVIRCSARRKNLYFLNHSTTHESNLIHFDLRTKEASSLSEGERTKDPT